MPEQLSPIHEKLTPTQELVIETLQARYRLGHSFWTFDTKIRSVIRQLETGGWVFTMSGVTENSIRVGLSPRAMHELFSESDYVSPLEKENIDLTSRLEVANDILRSRGMVI
jgi:hypothetical protein